MRRTPFEKAYEVPPVSQVGVRTFEGTYVLQDPDQPNKVTLIGHTPPPSLGVGHKAAALVPGLKLAAAPRGCSRLPQLRGELIGRMCSNNKGHKNVTEGTGRFREVRKSQRIIHFPR